MMRKVTKEDVMLIEKSIFEAKELAEKVLSIFEEDGIIPNKAFISILMIQQLMLNKDNKNENFEDLYGELNIAVINCLEKFGITTEEPKNGN